VPRRAGVGRSSPNAPSLVGWIDVLGPWGRFGFPLPSPGKLCLFTPRPESKLLISHHRNGSAVPTPVKPYGCRIPSTATQAKRRGGSDNRRGERSEDAEGVSNACSAALHAPLRGDPLPIATDRGLGATRQQPSQYGAPAALLRRRECAVIPLCRHLGPTGSDRLSRCSDTGGCWRTASPIPLHAGHVGGYFRGGGIGYGVTEMEEALAALGYRFTPQLRVPPGWKIDLALQPLALEIERGFSLPHGDEHFAPDTYGGQKYTRLLTLLERGWHVMAMRPPWQTGFDVAAQLVIDYLDEVRAGEAPPYVALTQYRDHGRWLRSEGTYEDGVLTVVDQF
jgi:hypothetical protein